MLRCVIIVASVALISATLSHLQQVWGQRELPPVAGVASPEWVRTADGWQPSRLLKLESEQSATLPTLHPVVVASFQLSASLLALVAFPHVQTVAKKRRGPSK